jgi:hypothetical protein
MVLDIIFILTICGTWLVTDGIFSICCYPQEKFRQHWVRVVRILIGLILVCVSYYIAYRVL